MRYNIFKVAPLYITKTIILIFLVMIFSYEFSVIIKESRASFLNVADIKVLGNNLVDTQTVLYLSKITKIRNIFKINIEVAKNMIETNPFIKAVGIQVNKNIFYINVKEREPYVFFKSGKNLITLDEEGVVLSDNSIITDFDLPILTGIKEKAEYEIGYNITNENVLFGLEWFRNIPIEFWSQISEINISNRSKVIIYTLEGMKIYVDNIKTFSKKFEILYNKLLELKEKKYAVEYFDLRSERDDLIYKEYEK